jgi:hypothetical protein
MAGAQTGAGEGRPSSLRAATSLCRRINFCDEHDTVKSLILKNKKNVFVIRKNKTERNDGNLCDTKESFVNMEIWHLACEHKAVA